MIHGEMASHGIVHPEFLVGVQVDQPISPVAQKQSTRLISGRIRSVTGREDQVLNAELSPDKRAGPVC